MKPSLFSKTDPMSSVFRKSEHETIASNIMTILARTGDKFHPMGWNDYYFERLKDSSDKEGIRKEKQYFLEVRRYLTTALTASFFSPAWEKIFDQHYNDEKAGSKADIGVSIELLNNEIDRLKSLEDSKDEKQEYWKQMRLDYCLIAIGLLEELSKP